MVGLSRLVHRLGLLGVVNEALLAVGVDASGLVVDETGVLFDTSIVSTSVPFDYPIQAQSPCPVDSLVGGGGSFHTVRVFLLSKFRGSRENWTPPACLRLTR